MAGTRKLGRTSDHRTAMLRAMAEKYITLAKNNTLASKRQAFAFITKEAVVAKLYNEIAPKYMDVNGGYCRITRIGPRRGDAAEMAIIELI